MRRDGYDRGDRLRRWQPVQPFVLSGVSGAGNKVTRSARELDEASHIILPGVGAFGDAMEKLASTGLVPELERQAENGKPLLGICLGMQMAIVEFARHVLDIRDAHSIELDPQTAHPVIHLMPDQNGVTDIGGTLRLGSYPCILGKDTKAYQLYGTEKIAERHRHRYEFNNDYREDMEKAGLVIAGTSLDGKLVEAIEVKDHDFYIGVQFHPEFKSRPNRPHPLFTGLVHAAILHSQK